MVRWWEDAADDDARRWLLLLGLLLGLDFSVHRTNALLLPGLLAWILLRRPRTLISGRAWLAGVGGVAAGLLFHLLIIPRAAADPVLNFGDPSTLGRFYEYVSLGQYGGGFLVRFFPRHAPFWSVQVLDFIRAVGANFVGVTGPLGALGVVPGAFGVLGMALLWRRHRLGTALVILLVLHAAATILYFNIPANFFRPFTRHYLPVFVSFGVAMAYGLGRTIEYAAGLNWGRERHAVALAALLLTVVPVTQVVRHHAAADGSAQYFAEDYARNLLGGLPRDAILFTSGDNDTWPLWYAQGVLGVRPDVLVVNLPLTNSVWFVEQLARRDATFPFTLPAAERRALAATPWPDTTVAVPVAGTPAALGLADGAVVPDTIRLHAAPTWGDAGVLRQDLVLLRMLQDNHWRRPLAFGMGVGPRQYAWFAPYRRVDGLHARVVPLEDPPANVAALRANLLLAYEYRGYADGAVRLDDVSRLMSGQYYVAFMTLANAESAGGEPERCQATHEAMLRLLPPARTEPGMSLDFCVRASGDRQAERSGSP
jgi:hypothetical protein